MRPMLTTLSIIASGIAMLVAAPTHAQPVLDEDETIESYAQRYTQWYDSVPQSERAWVMMNAMSKALAANTDLASMAGDPDEPGWEETVAFVEKNRRMLDLVHDAVRKEHLGVPLDLILPEDSDTESASPGLILNLPHLNTVRTLTYAIGLDTVVAAERGDTAHAARCVWSMHYLANHAVSTGFSTEYFVRFAIIEGSCNAIRRSSTVLEMLSDDDLASLAAEMLEEPGDRFTDILRSERWTSNDFLRWVYEDSEDGAITQNGARRLLSVLMMFSGMEGAPSAENVRAFAQMIAPLERQREAADALYGAVAADFADEPWELRSFRWVEAFEEIDDDDLEDPTYLPVVVVVPEFSGYYRARVLNAASTKAVALQLTLERHKRAHGEYPETLRDLDARFGAPEDFTDPYSGKPLRYEPRGSGVLIYSLGPDRDDDGGDPILDGSGEPAYPPEYVTLDEHDAMGPGERRSIDGDWVLVAP